MSTTYFIDPQGTGGTGLTEASPRTTLPAPAAGDVWRFKRGSTYSSTNQLGSGVPLVLTDFGNLSAPKPVISVNTTISTAGMQWTGDILAHNIHFADFQPATNAGVCMNFGVRGGGAINSGPGASGMFLTCDFSNIKGNAIQMNPNDGSTPTAAADFLVVLGCTGDNIGDDFIFAKVGGYLEVGWSDIRRVSQLTGTGDCIHNMDSFLQYAWIHDNYLSHIDRDTKQCIMIDDPTAGNPTGLAIVERNICIGALTDIDDNIPTVNHVPINVQMRTILRHNYIKTKRYGALVGPAAGTPGGLNEVYSNIFEVMATASGNSCLILVTDGDVTNNTFVRRNVSDDYAVGVQTSTAKHVNVNRNVFVGFKQAINGATSLGSQDHNAFYQCGTKSNGTNATTNDIDLTSDPFVNRGKQDFRPADARLFFKTFDRRYPDFFGQYASSGLQHVGACVGAF